MSTIYILHIEAAYDRASVAISNNGVCLRTVFSPIANKTADVGHQLIRDVLDEAQLTFDDLHAISLSSGPGSYTGLRIAAAMAKGICFAKNIPLIALPTLLCMTYGCIHRYGKTDFDTYIPMIDARRMEVFTTFFNRDLSIEQSFSSLILDENWISLLNFSKKIIFFGNGIGKIVFPENTQNTTLFDTFTISAEDQCLLAFQKYSERDFEELAYFEPNYFKAFYTPSN